MVGNCHRRASGYLTLITVIQLQPEGIVGRIDSRRILHRSYPCRHDDALTRRQLTTEIAVATIHRDIEVFWILRIIDRGKSRSHLIGMSRVGEEINTNHQVIRYVGLREGQLLLISRVGNLSASTGIVPLTEPRGRCASAVIIKRSLDGDTATSTRLCGDNGRLRRQQTEIALRTHFSNLHVNRTHRELKLLTIEFDRTLIADAVEVGVTLRSEVGYNSQFLYQDIDTSQFYGRRTQMEERVVGRILEVGGLAISAKLNLDIVVVPLSLEYLIFTHIYRATTNNWIERRTGRSIALPIRNSSATTGIEILRERSVDTKRALYGNTLLKCRNREMVGY